MERVTYITRRQETGKTIRIYICNPIHMMHLIYAIISVVSIMYIMQINAILFIELIIITVMYSIAVELFVMFLG